MAPSASHSPSAEAAAAEIGRECIILRARMVARAVTSILEKAMTPHGVSAPQLSILATLCLEGEATATELCHRLHVEKSTMSRSLGLLREKGYVEEAGPTPAGGKPVQVTADGRGVLCDAVPDWRQANAEAAELLGPDGLRGVRAAARHLRAHSL